MRQDLTTMTVIEYFTSLNTTLIPFYGFSVIKTGKEKWYHRDTFLETLLKHDNELLNNLVDEYGKSLPEHQYLFVNANAAKQILKDKTFTVYYNKEFDIYFIASSYLFAWEEEKLKVFYEVE